MNRLVAGLLGLSLAACTTPAAPTPSSQIPIPPLTTAGAIVTTVAGKCYPTARDYVDGLRDEARFCKPCGLGVDAQGNLLVADCFNHRIRVIRPDGQVVTLAGSGQPGYRDGPVEAAQFDHPLWTAIGADGALYVADSGNNCIRKITLP